MADCKESAVPIIPTPAPAPSILDEMPVVYEGPIPRHLRHSLEQVAPPLWNVRYLYVLTGPMGCIYIGQTYNPGTRLVRHRDRSRFWRFVSGVRVYRHEYQGTWPGVDGEIVDMERQAITDLVPICNLERILAEADQGAPWEAELKQRNLLASRRALRLMGGAS